MTKEIQDKYNPQKNLEYEDYMKVAEDYFRAKLSYDLGLRDVNLKLNADGTVVGYDTSSGIEVEVR